VNAVRLSMWRDLKPILHGLQERDDVRVIVLTGAGGNFSAGADIKEFAQNRMGPEQGMSYEQHYVGAVEAVRACAKPTIAAVTGNCMGGACALAMACDFRLADDTARFAIPAAKLGVALVVIGVLVQFAGRIPWLGRLPGDISIQRENFSFYFPLTTSIVVSVVLSLLLWLFRR